jgi:ferredoxin-type protein NapG
LLRPPGALDEDTFLASCIKCGQCLQVCPPQVIDLAGISQGLGIGTPFIVPQQGACILCRGLPCVLACPTGALDHQISEGKEAAMGLAVLSKPDTCLARKGENDILYELSWITFETRIQKLSESLRKLVPRLTFDEKNTLTAELKLENLELPGIPRIVAEMTPEMFEWLKKYVAETEQTKTACRICLQTCPISSEQPIVFQSEKENDSESGNLNSTEKMRPVIQRTCVGCGVCEEKCPAVPPSITIVSRKKWQPQGLKAKVQA